MTFTTIIVRWRGPFSLQEVFDSDEGNGPYLLTGSSLIEITSDQPLAEDRLEPVRLTERQRDDLSVLLRPAPGLLHLAVEATSNRYTLTFAPEVARRLHEGSATLMQAIGGGMRTIAVDDTGKIIGHGVLVAIEPAHLGAVVGGVWQLLSVVTAQQYLATINQRLARLEQGLEEIRQWLELQQAGVLTHSLAYVASVATALQQHPLTEQDISVFAQALEDQWVKCGEVAQAVRLRLEGFPARFKTLPLGAWLYLDESVAKANATIGEYERSARAYLMALAGRCLVTPARCMLPLNPHVAHDRFQALAEELAAFRTQSDHFIDTVEAHVRATMQATLSWEQANRSEQGKVWGVAIATQARVRRHIRELREPTVELQRRASAQLAAASAPLTLIVDLDQDGSVAQVYRLPDSPQLATPGGT